MEPIISVRGLGKSYRIQSGERKPYRTLRDDLVDFGKGLLKGPWGRSSTEEFWALKDINFDVYPGEVVGIIGCNGAGKSTLLKILSRVIQPTTGEAILHGRVASLLEVGTGFHPELTGRENIFISGSILGMNRLEIKRKFDEIVDFAEIGKFLDTPVKRYSSGMYVRLAFAVAAHLEPEILIVDEVLAVGDASFQKKCLGKMGDVATNEGKTVVFVSHDMEAVNRLCHTGALVKKGEIACLGNVSSVIQAYLEEGVDTQFSYPIQYPRDENIPGYAYKLIVEDEDGQPTIAIPVGKMWQIRIYLKLKRKIENLVVGIGFRTDTGTAMRTCWSEAQTLNPGEYEVLFREETLLFAPGSYSLIVGLSSYGISFQYAENSGILKIADFSKSVSNNLVKLTECGHILNPMRIKFNKINSLD
jgi:lipopolysaccharide transport system ATP-binding protein